MAELIPLEYRIATAQRALIRRWGVVLALTGVVAAGSFAYVFNWQRQQLAEYTRVNEEYSRQSVKKRDARQLIDRRAALARKMATVQDLSQDDLLLAILRNITAQFTENEMLDYLAVQAHARPGSDPKTQHRYFARVNGQTVNDATRSDLVDRLTKAAKQVVPPMSVSAENTSVVKILQGEAVRFQISCDEPVVRVADASADSGKAPQ
jgi:hypothetical protein